MLKGHSAINPVAQTLVVELSVVQRRVPMARQQQVCLVQRGVETLPLFATTQWRCVTLRPCPSRLITSLQKVCVSHRTPQLAPRTGGGWASESFDCSCFEVSEAMGGLWGW